MRAFCPINGAHNRFVTVAHVSEDWLVDEQGNFLDAVDSAKETVQGPNPGNLWTCEDCLEATGETTYAQVTQ